jgi:hypothetical protein
LEDNVLVRLGGYGFDEFEYAEEFEEALEAWRRGEGDVAEWPSLLRGEYW